MAFGRHRGGEGAELGDRNLLYCTEGISCTNICFARQSEATTKRCEHVMNRQVRSEEVVNLVSISTRMLKEGTGRRLELCMGIKAYARVGEENILNRLRLMRCRSNILRRRD